MRIRHLNPCRCDKSFVRVKGTALTWDLLTREASTRAETTAEAEAKSPKEENVTSSNGRSEPEGRLHLLEGRSPRVASSQTRWCNNEEKGKR